MDRVKTHYSLPIFTANIQNARQSVQSGIRFTNQIQKSNPGRVTKQSNFGRIFVCAFRDPLQPRHSCSTWMPVGLEQLDPGWPEADQSELRRGEEGQQQQQPSRGENRHRTQMGVARIELA